MSKEIIELLEEAIIHAAMIQSNCRKPNLVIKRAEILAGSCGKHGILHQALTLLKQQPPAGDFTKELRKRIADYRKTHNLSHQPYTVGLINRAEKACYLLDTSEAIKADLLAACERNREMLDICARVFLGTGEKPDPMELAEVINKNDAAISKAKLKEKKHGGCQTEG